MPADKRVITTKNCRVFILGACTIGRQQITSANYLVKARTLLAALQYFSRVLKDSLTNTRHLYVYYLHTHACGILTVRLTNTDIMYMHA